MNINEQFELFLQEGVHDKSIFKAVFLSGGPGSGKDYVLKNVLNQHGLVEINADKAHEYLSDKAHNLAQPTPNENHIKKKIKNVGELKQLLALHGRNGIIVNGSGDDHKKTKEIKKGLERIGYDTSMVHVHADDEVSKKRNIERSQRGGRSVDEKSRKQKWDASQEARRHHAQMFGDNYVEYDNSDDLREAPPELVKKKQDDLSLVHDHVHNFINQPPTSEKSQKWVEKQLQIASTSTPRKGVHKLPHPDSNALQQAREAGLAYYGNGRYGKGGKVTHHTINDQLTEIPEENPKKKLKEGILSEAVSITVSGDSVEDVTRLLGSIKSDEVKPDIGRFSSKSDALTLGRNEPAVGVSNENMSLTNADIEKILEEQFEVILDNFGHPKVYIMKSMAQKDALIYEGSVCNNPGGRGFIVKVKKKGDMGDDNSMVKESVSEDRREEGRTSSRLITETKEESCVCKEETDTKRSISFSELKNRIRESIDKGIETGLSMSSGGEAPLRAKEKQDKKETKIQELTGDETTASIGDQKEDELKKKGIDLSTFKSKKII